MDMVIYGAQGIALAAYKAVKELFPEKIVLCFLVTVREGNPNTLDGLLVRELKEFVLELDQNEKDNIEVLICTPECFMEEIEKSLDMSGLNNHIRLDSVKLSDMQEKIFLKNRKFRPIIDYPMGNSLPNLEVYMAKSGKDKELITEYLLPEYLIPVQAGADRMKKRIADVLDNEGDNISSKNGNYSELTVLYWIWKHKIINDQNIVEYYGLAHYRRFLWLDDRALFRLQRNDIDVVLPYPMPYEPNIEAHHKRYLSADEWNAVLQALKELQPEYGGVFQEILKKEYMYNYNIIVAKKHVLADYCDWLFPILFRIEEIIDPYGIRKPNRYIGYIGESLETLYFMYNKHNLCIAHTGCKFLL